MSDEVILENYQIQMMTKFYAKGKNRFIITHNRGNGVTTAIVWYIINRMRLTDNTNVLLINGNSSTIVTEIFKRIKQAFAGEIGLDEPYCIKLKNGSSLRSDKYIVDGCTYDIIYCDGKPDGAMWIDGNFYQKFLNRDGKFIVSRIPHNHEIHPSLDEFWSKEEYKVFTDNDDTLPIFVPFWMPSWKNKYGVKLRRVGRLDAMCYNYDDIMKYVETGYYVDGNIDEFYISNMCIAKEIAKDKQFGKQDMKKTPWEAIEQGMKKYDEWLKTRDYKGVNLTMGIDLLETWLHRLENERTTFVGYQSQVKERADDYFYDKAIEQIENNIKECSGEIALAKAIKKDSEDYKKLDIDAFIANEQFEISRILCSKDMIDVMDKLVNMRGEACSELINKCTAKVLASFGYSEDEIKEKLKLSDDDLNDLNDVDFAIKDLQKEGKKELPDVSIDNAIITPELDRIVKDELRKYIAEHNFNDAFADKDSDASVESVEPNEKNIEAPKKDIDIDDQIDGFDAEYDIDDPVSYRKDSNSGEYYNVPLTGDIVDWGGINTSVGAVQQKDTSKKNFEAYLVIDGVDYSPYVDSVTADYMEREVMIEIVDDDNNAIPKLVNYWEGLYNCDEEPLEDDIIVRTNSGNKSFETFKDCAIVDFTCSSYVNEDFPRRATLVYSFGKSSTEYCAD